MVSDPQSFRRPGAVLRRRVAAASCASKRGGRPLLSSATAGTVRPANRSPIAGDRTIKADLDLGFVRIAGDNTSCPLSSASIGDHKP